MELSLALLCERAEERPDGKLEVSGIFHDLFAPGFPAMQEEMILVLVIEWDRRDQGSFNMKAELVSPDGEVGLTVDGKTDVHSPPAHEPPARTRLIMPVKEVVFPRPGRYHLRVKVKGERLRGPSLHLLETQEGS